MRPITTISNLDFLILCGGRGTRLRPVVFDKPKVMVDINGRPFLDIILENIAAHGFKRIILSVGHLKEQIIDYYSKQVRDYQINFLEEKKPLGTGGAIKKAESMIKSEYFFVANGDSFFPVDFKNVYDYHLKNESLLSVVLTQVENTGDCGIVELDETGKIKSFNEKAPAGKSGLINAGIYLMKKDVFSHMPEKESFSIEYDFFPKVLESRRCYGFVSEGELIDIGTPERYEKANKILK